jgi:hypothetical protein
MSQTIHSFELIFDVDDEFTDLVYDQLHDAGCDDAVFVTRSGRHFAEFDRLSESFARAVLSAIADLESVDGVRATRVEFDELVTATAIAERIGRSRQNVNQLISGTRGPGSFPAAAPWVEGAKLYEWPAVAHWINERLPGVELPASEEAEFVTAINGALTAHGQVDRLHRYDERLALASILRRDLDQLEQAGEHGSPRLREVMQTVASTLS